MHILFYIMQQILSHLECHVYFPYKVCVDFNEYSLQNIYILSHSNIPIDASDI